MSPIKTFATNHTLHKAHTATSFEPDLNNSPTFQATYSRNSKRRVILSGTYPIANITLHSLKHQLLHEQFTSVRKAGLFLPWQKI
jgi:hypothetical protein